jgi:hypothetical protein
MSWFSVVLTRPVSRGAMPFLWARVPGRGPRYCAWAPETTSMISLVIAAWRTLFM